MKFVKLTDFLTKAQIKKATKLYPDRLLIRNEIIIPDLNSINRKLGQENDADYLSYAVVFAIEEQRKR